MTFEDIISLAKAGYTKDDIFRLTQAEAPANTETGTVKPAPQLNGSNAPDPKPAAPAGDLAMTSMQAQIDALKQMMQINNMLTVNQNAPKERTIDDIFAEIINPPALNNKDKTGG